MARIPRGIETEAPGSYQTRLNKRENKLAESVREDTNIEDTFEQSLVCSASDDADGTAYTGTAGDQNTGFSSGRAQYEFHVEAVAGTPVVIYPHTATGSAGMIMPTQVTNCITDFEITNGNSSASRSAYVVGSFPGAKTIFFECDVDITDVSTVTGLWAGFRNVETYTTPAAYDTYATIYKPDDDSVSISTELDGGGAVTTDTTVNWTDGDNFALRVEVDNDGTTRFYVAGTEYQPSASLTWTAGDTIIPFIAADATAAANVFTFATWKCGTK